MPLKTLGPIGPRAVRERVNIYVIFEGDIYFTHQFLKNQKVKQERSCVFFKKFLICLTITLMSDLSRFTVSVPVRAGMCAYKSW
jgi:hypothetical protein